MAIFPQVQAPVLVEIAPGANPADSPDLWETSGLYVDITADTRVQDGITIEQGRPDEAGQVDPSQCTLTINNRTGNYSTRNPLSPYYGLLKKNTPLRIRYRRLLDTFTRTVGAGSWGTSDNGIVYSTNAAFAVNGSAGTVTLASGGVATALMPSADVWDFDFVGVVSLDAVPVGAQWQHRIRFRGSATANNYEALFQYETTGNVSIFLIRSANSVTTTIASAFTGLSVAAGQQVTVRVKADGSFVGAKAWITSGTQPAGWTASAVETDYGLDNYAYSTAIRLQSQRVTGNTATTTSAWDSITITTPLFLGNVVEWPVRWDKSGNDSTAPISAAGVLRRLQQGQTPLKSPLYTTLYGQNPTPTAYWPLEDDSGATSAVGVGPGVKPASVYSASFGFSSTVDPQLLGASSTMTIDQNTTITGVIPATTLISSGWLWIMAIYTPAWPPGATVAVPVRLRGSGSAATWQIQFANVSGGQIYAVALDSGNTVLANVSGVVNFVPGAWHIVQLESWQNGANVDNLVRTWNLSTGVNVATATTSFAGTIGQPNSWSVYGDSTAWSTGSVGHFAFYNRRSVFTVAQVLAAGQGYSGEAVAARIARLCTEQAVRLDVASNAAGSTLMGRQTEGTFLDIVREAEATGIGVLSEFSGGLRYRTRDRRYNQTQRIALDFAAGNIAEPPEPTDDDQRVRNDWTVTRSGGSSARVTNDAHILAVGRYDDSIEINTATDDALFNHAAFRVFLGTYDDLRWPAVQIDLAHNPELIGQFLSLEVGTVVTVANPPANLPVGILRLVVEGWTQTITPFGWDVTLTCSSNQPWRNAPLNDSERRFDSLVSTLGAAVTTSATSLSVVHPTGTAGWTLSAADWPFDIGVTGEQMTVTAVSGAGTTQTFTVTRSVNGIVKSHLINEQVTLFRPSYFAL